MSDLISRQAAIDIERNATVDTNPSHFEAHQKFTQFMDDAEVSSFGRWQWSNGFNTALTAVEIDLKKLPSAQPDHNADVSKKVERTDETAQNVSDSDSISRKAVTDALAKFVPYAICDESTESYANGLTDAYNLILQLPSAQPEIIRCKDCKWWDKDGDSPRGYCLAMKHGYISSNWEIGIYRRYKGDFYCADAEREEEDE